MSYESAVLADNPYLYWRFQETTGTNANDASPNNHDGTYEGGYTLAVEGPIDRAVELNGTTGNVSGQAGGFGWAANFPAYEGFAWRDTEGSMDVLFGGHSSTAPRLMIAAGNNDVHFTPDLTGNSTSWVGAWPGTARWVHWVLVFDSSANNVRLYIDGESKGDASMVTDYSGSPGYLRLGTAGNPLANYFDGKLAEFAMYSTALSAQRIAIHYEFARWANRPDWEPATTVSPMLLARTGFGTSQRVLGGAPSPTVMRGACGWHGTRQDPHRGAYAVAHPDGPFADLVGERVRISYYDDPRTARSIVVYVHNESYVADDLSLTRPAYARLAPLATVPINVAVEVIP